MEPKIRERFNNNILSKILERYKISSDQLHLLDGFESFIYEFERGEQAYILRIGHSLRRPINLLRGEVDWINYLVDGGVGAARAVPSPNGEFVEVIEDGNGDQFLVTTFLKAAGGPSWEGDRWNDALKLNYGRLLGRIHALSKNYIPKDPTWRRLEWDDDLNLNMLTWIPADQTLVQDQAAAILKDLNKLPKGPEYYGLIHQDAHLANFFVDDHGHITLFDFDDCVYSWFIYDIAMVIFYLVTNDENPEEIARQFWPLFWQGYTMENSLDSSWLQELPLFFKFREVDLYAVIHRSMDVNDLQDRWVKAFMNGRRERIEQEVPYLDLDFTTL